MAIIKTANNVKETTTTTGTGTLNLDGAYAGSQTFVAGVGNGAKVIYTITDIANAPIEIGIGTVVSGTPDTLQRNVSVIYSTNANALVNLPAVTHFVHIGPVAENHAGDLNFHGASLINATETVQTVLTGEAMDIDIANGHSQEIYVTGVVAGVTISNVPDSGRLVHLKLIFRVDGTGGYSILMPVGFTPANSGFVPTINNAANAITIVEAITYDGGTTWYYWIPENKNNAANTELTQDVGGNIDIDLKFMPANGYKVALTQNGHLNAPTNVVDGNEFNIVIYQDATVAYTLTADAVFKFGTAGLTIDATLSSVTVIKCIAVSSTYIAARLYKEV